MASGSNRDAEGDDIVLADTKKAAAYIKNNVLYIKKRTRSEWVLLFIMLWPFLINLVTMLPGPLRYAEYLCDGIMLFWCLWDLVGFFWKKATIQRDMIAFLLWILCFVGYTFLVYIFNYQSLLYYLWGIRVNFRCYFLFFRILLQIREDNADEWFGLLDILFWINAVLSLFQFAIGGVRQDHLGGIFGTVAGTNGFTLIFLSIVVVKSQLKLFENEEKLWVCLLKCGTALLIAAMAELKFYLFLFVLQMVFVVILTRFSWKKLIILPLCAIAVSFSMDLLAQWFSASGTFDIESVIAKAFQENYSSADDLNRLSAIGMLTREIVKNPLKRVFGFGLGNCDSANFAFLRTPFYEKYSYLHYKWFSAPMVFLETGYMGLGFYLGFFVVTLIMTIKKKQSKKGNNFYCNMSIIFSLTAIALAFYNSSLRYEAGWMIYVVLALPFIVRKQELTDG